MPRVAEIRTARLVLRRARESDVAPFFEMLSDPETMRYWSTPPHASIEVTRPWVMSMVDAPESASDEFVIEHEGEVVGKVGCYRLPEIGLVLRRDRWGRGLMYEAARAVIDHVWRHHDVPELRADVDPRNDASLRVLGKLGFVETHRAARTWCVGGVWTDSIYLALARPRPDGENA
jgi:RimJ/RimL family protein N-acetyltransferase